MYFRKQSPAVVRHDAVTNEMLFHFVFYPRLGLTAILLWGVFLLRARGKSPSCHQESNQLRSLLCWKWSKHSTHTAPWTQEKDLCCLTSRIYLYIPVMPSQETWEIKTTNRIGYYPSVTQSNLTVTITFQVIAAHLHESSICVLLPGQLASRDLLVKLCMTDFALNLVQNLVSKSHTYSFTDMNILKWVHWGSAKTIKVLEHLSYKEKLRELRLLGLEKKRLRLNAYGYLRRRCKTQSQTLSGIHWKDKRQQAQIGKKYIQFKHDFHLFVFKLSVNKHWNILPREVIESPALGTVKTWPDTALSNLL